VNIALCLRTAETAGNPRKITMNKPSCSVKPVSGEYGFLSIQHFLPVPGKEVWSSRGAGTARMAEVRGS